MLAASVMVGLFALAALWLGGEAQHRAADAREAQQRAETSAADANRASTRLRQSAARLSHLARASGRPGQRTEALRAITEAMDWQPSRELRDEALSALLLPDLGTNLVWHKEPGFEVAAAYDANLEHFILNNDRQPARAIVRRAADGVALMDEEGFGWGTPFWQFSPDGRLVAIAFRPSQVGVWDWRQKQLVARFPSLAAEWGEPPFDFSPDGQQLWLLTTNRTLASYDLTSRQPVTEIVPKHPGRSVRLSPSGRWAAIACGKDLEVWDLSSHTPRATRAFTNDIWRLAWQPGEERLAVGCYGGLFLWDIGAPEAVTLRQDGAMTVLFFSADGDLLFTAGWNIVGEVWSVRTLRLQLQLSAASPLGLNQDQTQLSVAQDRVGYGLQQYLPPVGVREWPGPPALGSANWSADVDPQERRLLTAHAGGWLVRDTDSGRELARALCGPVLCVSFSTDGSNVLACTRAGLQRWPLGLDARETTLTAGAPQVLFDSAGRAPDLAVFAADHRHAAVCQEGWVTVLDVEKPGEKVRFQLQRPSDNSLQLSPDGRWLFTGHHNRHGVDWYDLRQGKFVRRFAEEGFAGVVCDPHTGAMFTCAATGFSRWNLETGQPERSALWRMPSPYQGFLGFAADHRLALVKANPSAYHLYDLQTDRDFATLDFRDIQVTFGVHWCRDGRRLLLIGSDGGFRSVDLAALRRELVPLGLDWPDEEPSREFPAPARAAGLPAAAGLARGPAGGWRALPGLVWWVAAGVLMTVGIGHYVLRCQRRLFASYLQTDALAAQQARALQETQAALLHREKIQALGTMAAGVAHDFNNLLSVIRLASELIEEQMQPDGVAKENLDAIHQAVLRGRGIVNSMLGYARDDGVARPLAPGGLISDAVALLSKPFLSGLVLEMEVDRALPELRGRKGRVEQMLLNLIVNAAEAMGGRGMLRLAAREVGEPSGCMLPPRTAGSYVEISVADSGPGIAAEVLPRIFEPFFTTKNKSAQRGTGLGLSMIYTMAREDGIGVAVSSLPGRGSTFRLFLPVEATAREADTELPISRAPTVAPEAEVDSTAPMSPVGVSRPLAQEVTRGLT